MISFKEYNLEVTIRFTLSTDLVLLGYNEVNYLYNGKLYCPYKTFA